MEVLIDKEVKDYLKQRDKKNLLIYQPITEYRSHVPEIQVESMKITDEKINSSYINVKVDEINVFVERNISYHKILRVYKILSIPYFLTVIGVIVEN